MFIRILHGQEWTNVSLENACVCTRNGFQFAKQQNRRRRNMKNAFEKSKPSDTRE